eukprot:CAMPEP_0119028420 /NCGR_PEP_ID=MMETSP1176-20130426/38846_1 /TAXON_ID=265551 /ORGANISM="Synedropsis recta cf, Strain CCMP1620" /LENGTH=592 /DNA_ID=CAMNT_0006984545 /DNA_START=49 /DNA_END=1827 /DNA_ORIENTATION=+
MSSFNSLLLLLLVGSSLAFQRPALVAHKSALFTSGGGTGASSSTGMPITATAPTTKKSAVIVGGGPVGLATALTLSNAPHYYDITLVEQAPQASGYDPTKAYLYLVNPRGQVWTKRFPRVQELLEERGSVNTGMGNFVTVPGDPSEPVPDRLPAKDGEASYWIPRHGMVTLLEEAIQEQQQQKEKDKTSSDIGSIQVLPCKACLSLEPQDNGQIEVTVQDTKDPTVRFQQSFIADLVVGADGANSAVRQFLAHPSPTAKTNWLTDQPKKFRTHRWASAASGLRMKVLQFPPGFLIPPSNIPTQSETIYAIRSVNTGPKDYISLGLLPVKDTNFVRPTNVITRPNHDVWKLQQEGGTGADVKAWFQKAFPRLDFDSMIQDAEWQRFASAQGTTFPKCQYCTGMQVTSPNNGNTGVVLVGDAIHAFPPDIGQGINAGLADVEALDRALKGKDIVTGNDSSSAPPATLAEALETYERVRAPEVKSLIRLARFGSPYQYRQPEYRDRVGRTLWTMNVALRMLLNKLSMGLIPQAAILSAMDKSVTYRKLMRRSDITTVALYSVAALVLRQIGGINAVVAGGVVATALWFITYWFGK